MADVLGKTGSSVRTRPRSRLGHQGAHYAEDSQGGHCQLSPASQPQVTAIQRHLPGTAGLGLLTHGPHVRLESEEGSAWA